MGTTADHRPGAGWPRVGRWLLGCLLLPLLLAEAVAQSRSVIVQPSVGVTVTGTSNAAVDAQSGLAQRDVVVDLRPEVYVRSRGARMRVDATFGVSFTDYLQGNGRNRISPTGSFGLNATLAEDSLFLDVGASGTRTPGSVFGAEIGDTATTGAATTGSIRVSPYFYREVVRDVFILVRSDNVLANTFGSGTAVDRLGDVRHQSNILKVDRRPQPVGASLEVSQDQTKYASRPDTALEMESIRLTGTMGLDSEVLVGVIGGYERSSYLSQRVSANRYGVMTIWRPTERTDVEAELEHRFFGRGWKVEARHRLPTAAFEVALQRTASALPSSLAGVSAGGGVNSLLDSIYRTRFPDDADRAALIQETLRSRGVQSTLFAPGDVFAQYAQVQQNANVRMLLIGPRNQVSLSAFYTKASALVGAADFSLTARNDARQYGTSLDINRRLSPQTTVNAILSRRSARTLGTIDTTTSIQTSLALGASLTVSMNSSASLGMRRTVTTSSRLPPPGNETSVSGAFVIRF